jgi:hypothetical protein
MGNRAVITNDPNLAPESVGVYLHYYGGRDSVAAFLKYCELAGYRPLTGKTSYGWAALTTVIGNFMNNVNAQAGTSVGVETLANLDCDNGNNGIYVVKGWKIVGRKNIRDGFKEQKGYAMNDMLLKINAAQPKNMNDMLLKINAAQPKKERERMRDVLIAFFCKR